MTAHIFTKCNQFSVRRKKTRSVQSASALEYSLRVAKLVRERNYHGFTNRWRFSRQNRATCRLQRLNGSLPAYAAARCHIEVSLQPLGIDFDAGIQRHYDLVVRALDSGDIRSLPDHSLGEEKACRQLGVVTRSTHRDRNVATGDTDL